MSAASDKFEKDVAENVNKLPGIKASRPSVGTDFSDVKIEYGSTKTWLEVKMTHKDNLSNPRVFYAGGKWQTTYKTPAAKAAVDILNASPEAATFVKKIAKYAKIPASKVIIPTNKTCEGSSALVVGLYIGMNAGIFFFLRISFQSFE